MHGAEVSQAATPAPVFLDLVELARDLRRRWLWILIAAALGFVAALGYLNIAKVRYTSALRITPAASSQTGLSGTLGRLGGLASLAGVSVRQGSEGASPFDLYLARLTSRELAAQLARDKRIMQTAFKKEWDPATQTFRDRPGPLRPIRNLLYSLAGQDSPAWLPPGPERLQTYLEKTVVISPPGPKDPPITTLVVETPDPEFGVHLLNALHRQADDDVRASSLKRAEQYAAHLTQKLATTEVAEHRRTLSEALLEQERAVMMATSTGPYAALPLEPASGPSRPTSPKPVPALMLGIIVGGVVGLLAVTAVHLLSNRRQSPAEA